MTEDRSKSLVNNLLVFFLIALSGSILHVGFFTITYAVALLTILLVVVFQRKYAVKSILLFFTSLAFFTTILVVNFVFSASNDFNDYKAILMQFFLSLLMLFALKERKADLKFHIYRVLRFLVISSFFGFFLSFLDIGVRVEFPGGYSSYTILGLFYYFADLEIGPLNLFRNQGIFWEPGLLAVYANIFLFLSLFIYKNKKNSMCAVICILSTVSTTGIFMMLIQFLVFGKRIKLNILQKMSLSVLLLIVGMVSYLSFMDKRKLNEESGVSSYGLRVFDFYSGIMVVKDNPLVGVGLNQKAFIKERDRYLSPEMEKIFYIIEERGNSNSFLMLFYSLGIIVAFIWLYFLYKQEIFGEYKGLFFIVLIISFINEPLVLAPFFLLFIFSGFQKIINIKHA